MTLAIDRLIQAQGQSWDKTAETQASGIFEAVTYGQHLTHMGEDFLKAAEQTGSWELNTLGNDLVHLAERMTGGLAKMAADSYDVALDYADIVTDLYKVACYMDNLYQQTGNGALYGHIKTAEAICDNLTAELGSDYVARVWMHKEASEPEAVVEAAKSPGLLRRAIGGALRGIGDTYTGKHGRLAQIGAIAAPPLIAGGAYGIHKLRKNRRSQRELENALAAELAAESEVGVGSALA